MFLEKQEGNNASRKISNCSRIKQNYVPFMSKSIRFQQRKGSDPLPNTQLYQSQSQSIKNHSPNRQKTTQTKISQFFFKSDLKRFESLQNFNTPSPNQYHLQPNNSNKDGHKPKISPRKIILSPLETVPTIPDIRNKYGYRFQQKSFTLVNKSRCQLQKQRTLMKQYQQTLTNQIQLEKKQKDDYLLPKVANLKKIVSNMFQKQFDKQNNGSHNRQILGLIRPKIGHLYQYHPLKSQKISSASNQVSSQKFLASKKYKRNQKFQFFNSSEKRFKTIQHEQVIFKRKQTIRDYLSKFINKVNIQ